MKYLNLKNSLILFDFLCLIGIGVLIYLYIKKNNSPKKNVNELTFQKAKYIYPPFQFNYNNNQETSPIEITDNEAYYIIYIDTSKTNNLKKFKINLLNTANISSNATMIGTLTPNNPVYLTINKNAGKFLNISVDGGINLTDTFPIINIISF